MAPTSSAEDANGPVVPDVPAGGLDMPATRPPLETERFPGESELTDEERNRWLILHFSIPRTIMTRDIAEGRTTDAELNDVLSSMAWGTITQDTREFMLESEDPTLEPPHESLISYAEYVERTYPADQNMEEDAREENRRMASEKRVTFTNPGEPGAKFRPMFDQMVKNLAHSNKALMKAYDIKKPILNEDELPEDPNKSEAQNIMRFGRHRILPAFWHLIIQLTKSRRRFSVVFRTFCEEQLTVVQKEYQVFCSGAHPAYCGQNKTQKPPPLNGDKGSRDIRLNEANIGRFDRFSGRLEFPNRPSSEKAPEPVDAVEGEAPQFRPTEYDFQQSYHSCFAGLKQHILGEANAAGIVDDYAYWNAKERASDAGKLLLVDHGGSLAQTSIQHIFFDGHIGRGSSYCVDVRDVVSGEPVPYEQADNIFLHRVDMFQAITDTEYFVKALDLCEVTMSQKILETRRMAAPGAGDAIGALLGGLDLRNLPPKEYLYQTVLPALLPALEACQRDRPKDPIEYIAFYMLRHPKQYSKSLMTP